MAPRMITKSELLKAIPPVDKLMDSMRDAFVAYSSDRAVVAPVQHVTVEGKGDACVKSGYLRGDASWVVKIAGGWPGNAARGLSNSQGCMLLFGQETGQLECLLADEGHLTDVRTAAAAALCVKEFAPENVKTLCVVGTGVIAKLVVEYCRPLFSAGAGAELVVVSRSAEAATKFGNFAAGFGWELAGDSPAEGRSRADVVVTCTPATTPVVPAVRKGACVVALGADGAGKRELGPGVLSGDVLLLVDSAAQCLRYGEAAYKGNKVTCTELGAYYAAPTPRKPGQTVVCDLTGVAVQDVAIATTVRDAVVKPAWASMFSCGLPAGV